MDSVIMTTPSSTMKLRSRMRSAANAICARVPKGRPHGTKGASRPLCRAPTAPRHCTRFLNNIHRNNLRNLNDLQRVLASPNNNADNNIGSTLHRTNINREVYHAWCGRVGEVTRIPGESVQALFNDMQLYPSKTQVLEMLQCARQCSRRNSSQFLTFGEFCVFAGELRRRSRGRQHHHTHVQKTTRTLSQCDVFLGGSCNPTTWRADIAIPTLSKLGISYYNPQVSTWGPELMAAEHDAKESASVLLFVVDSQTRCVAGMIEVAHLVAKQRCLVLVVYPFTRGQSIMDEPLSSQEFVDLTEGQSTLLTLVRNQGVIVHSNLSTALQCTVSILRGSEYSLDIVAERKLTDKLMKLREVFDAADSNRSGELPLSSVISAYYQLTGSHLRISDLYSIMNLSDHTNPDEVRINFEQFCSIVAEFTTDGCNITTTTRLDDWVNQPLQRQSSGNNNTSYEYNALNQQNGETNTLNSTNHYETYDVYLGGSCIKKTTWRKNIAIPLLKKYGVTYYNPSLHENHTDNISVCNRYYNSDMYEQDLNDNSPSVECPRNMSVVLAREMDVMNKSKVLLFVITNETRSITSMILAAHYIALKKNVVLCIQQLPLDTCIIGSDLLTKQAIKDYNRARAYLSEVAKHDNVPTFENVKEAVECAINLAQQR